MGIKIWIDLATGPQVLFYRPIIRELKNRGNDVLITTRKFIETTSLADKYQMIHTTIGAHGGATMTGKLIAVLSRAAKLIQLIRHYDPSIALGSSYTQALVTPLLRIPFVVCGDYEGNPANHISCRVAKRILVPNLFYKPNLIHFGAKLSKIISYGGIKENVYLADFVPDTDFLSNNGIPNEKIIVTMRPPSEVSSYHRFKNHLFDELLIWVSDHPDTFVVLLPRGGEQRQKFEAMKLQNIIISKQVMDGPNLVYNSDLLIGAGGTMNREATVFGTPVYTVFKGKLGSVDEQLIGLGKLVRIEERVDISKIRLQKKTFPETNWVEKGKGLVNEIVERILEVYQ